MICSLALVYKEVKRLSKKYAKQFPYYESDDFFNYVFSRILTGGVCDDKEMIDIKINDIRYLKLKIKHLIYDYLREHTRKNKRLFNIVNGENEFGDVVNIVELIPDYREVSNSSEDTEFLSHVIDQADLSDKQKFILYAHYYKKMTFEEIAFKLHTVKSNICMIHGRTITLLREIYNDSCRKQI